MLYCSLISFSILKDFPPYVSMDTQSQTPMSHSQFQPTRQSNSPIPRQMQQGSTVIHNPTFLPHHQLLQPPSCSSYRATSPATSSLNSDGGNRFNNSSFSPKQPPLLASTHSNRQSPTDALQSSTFHTQPLLRSTDIDGQVKVSVPNLKSNMSKSMVNDCRLTINPVAKYSARPHEDPQSWAPLLKAAHQESTL